LEKLYLPENKIPKIEIGSDPSQKEIIKKYNISEVILASNLFKELPWNFLSCLQYLRKLDMSRNRIKDIPDSVEWGELVYLETVDLSCNQLQRFPWKLSKCSKLQ